MAIKGGYKIINFKNVNIETGNSAIITGVYDAIETSYSKALMLSGLMIDSVEQGDFFANYNLNDTAFEFNYNGGTLSINQNDEVSYTV